MNVIRTHVNYGPRDRPTLRSTSRPAAPGAGETNKFRSGVREEQRPDSDDYIYIIIIEGMIILYYNIVTGRVPARRTDHLGRDGLPKLIIIEGRAWRIHMVLICLFYCKTGPDPSTDTYRRKRCNSMYK